MTHSSAFDIAIREARHLLFAFDGPIRSANTGRPTDSTTPSAPHIHDALAACYESGRSATIISIHPQVDVRAYLDARDLSTQVTVVAQSVGEAASTIEASPADCLFITSSPGDVKMARAVGIPSIGYAQTPDEAAHLIDAGANAVFYSMADLTLEIRAQGLTDLQ